MSGALTCTQPLSPIGQSGPNTVLAVPVVWSVSVALAPSPELRLEQFTSYQKARPLSPAGTPLRSETGKLTVSELITESRLRRDIAYDHPHLIDTFKARAKARDSAPAALTALAAERDNLRGQLTAAKDELARERSAASILRKVITELSLELGQAREELTTLSNVTPLRTAPGPVTQQHRGLSPR